MRVRVLVEQHPELHGKARSNCPWVRSGEECDLDEDLARALVADGHAELIEEEPVH